MKILKKLLRVSLVIFCIIFLALIVSGVSFYHISTYGISLDTNKLNSSRASSMKIYDASGKEITTQNENFIEINQLNSHTKNAFISTEDKRFYSHNGIDYLRIGGALISNVKSKSFSEGASTISQQLIKNTQLSNQKTIKRKLKEFKLARELEKKYSKDEILEMYLNNIYFGNGTYGIENASNYYFGKSAKNLTLEESALLAATINAPNYYNIQRNQERVKNRRNLILTLMKDQNKITEEEYISAKNAEISLNITKKQNNNYIFNEIIEEACKILNKNENGLKNSNLIIYTNYNLDFTNTIIKNTQNKFKELSQHDICNIVIDNKTNTLVSIIGNSNVLDSKKQPGSTIKPILVYAPAIENEIISPSTKILDEEINISGYSPENADKKYHGFITTCEALKNSYNIPAVKLLNEIGISNAQEFATKLNINFKDTDNNLAIALGGFTEGTTLKQLVDAYAAFANDGYFEESKNITKMILNGKEIYAKPKSQIKTMKNTTACQITDMLTETSKTGTARRLSDLNFDVASKTGTVGKPNSNKNTDAYCVSYTTNHTIITYIGGENLNENINGSTYPTMINKLILNELYKNNKPDKFTKPISLNIKNVDLTNDYTSKTKFIDNQKINLHIEGFNFENRKPIISFFATPNYYYNIKRIHEKKEEKISSFTSIDEPKIIKFEDIHAIKNEIYEYYIEVHEKSTNKKFTTNHIKLKSF